MIYFLNKNLIETKKLKDELKKIYGLNKNKIRFIFNFLGINLTIYTKDIKKKLLNNLKNYILKNLIIDNELKKYQQNLFKLTLNIKTIKSLRKLKGLPVNGQRTKTNAKTSKKLFI